MNRRALAKRTVAFALALGVSLASGCTPTNPLDPDSTPRQSTAASTTSAPATGATNPTGSQATTSGYPTQSQLSSPTPIYPTLPSDQQQTPGNSHIQAGRWAFVSVVEQAGTVTSAMAVRVNGAWVGEPGSLADRTIAHEPGQPTIDMTLATPYFISFSYVVLSGDAYAAPELELMPGPDGTMWRVSSPLADMDCPDYWPLIERDFGLELRRCVVAVTVDEGTPRALVQRVPDAEREFWYFDMPLEFGSK